MLVNSCYRDKLTVQTPPTPFNPYDTLNYNTGGLTYVPPDSNTFLGIHTYILSPKCAQPACHDGSFEPDYRTVQSAYNTLVYAPDVKAYTDTSFHFRVVPFDTTHSWLHCRLTTNDQVLGRMPLYSTLPASQIKIITNWINNGAPDIFGNIPNVPNVQPSFYGLVAFLTSNGNRIDTARGGFPLNPMRFPKNSTVDVWFGVLDDNPQYPFQLGDRKIKLSTNAYGFGSATAQSLITETTNYKVAPAFNGAPVPYFLHYQVNTSQYKTGDVVYMRVYVKDNNHTSDTEIPTDTSPFYLQTYVSFVVQ